MKVKKIQASCRRTINLGNFESLTLECGLEASLEEGENEIEALHKLYSECSYVIKLQYQNALKDVLKDVKEKLEPINQIDDF